MSSRTYLKWSQATTGRKAHWFLSFDSVMVVQGLYKYRDRSLRIFFSENRITDAKGPPVQQGGKIKIFELWFLFKFFVSVTLLLLKPGPLQTTASNLKLKSYELNFSCVAVKVFVVFCDFPKRTTWDRLNLRSLGLFPPPTCVVCQIFQSILPVPFILLINDILKAPLENLTCGMLEIHNLSQNFE